MSRGAKKAYFIDNSSEAINCIRENIAFTKFENESTVLKGDALSCLYDIHDEHVDIIFLDPPYDLGIEEKIFSILYSMKNIDSDTLVILESSLDKEFSFDGFELVRCKEYKTNKHGFYRRIK